MRWIFFSKNLPRTWEWWAIRETALYASALTVIGLLINTFFIPPEASMEMKTQPIGIMTLCLTMWFWMVRKYSFFGSCFFGWGVGLPASLIVAPPGLWGSIVLSIGGLMLGVRAFSTGPQGKPGV